jgi:RNA-directed DNA polymerase
VRPEFLQLISSETQMPLETLQASIATSHARIRRVEFRKRNGEMRFAYQAATTIKPVLMWLRIRVLSELQVSPIAVAFRKGCSILKNAQAHKDSKYSVRVDIKDFFPSITSGDVLKIIRSSGHLGSAEWTVEDVCELIDRVCFDRLGRLPIGFATSPDLANVVMYGIDSALLEIISDTKRYGSVVLTRYADDFVFSTDKRGACAIFVEDFRKVLSRHRSPTLRINEEKTRFMSRAGGSTLVTGLRVNNQGAVRVLADYRDHVRLLLHHFKAGRIKAEERSELAGHLAFIEHVDPGLFTKLSFRYSDQIAELRGTKSQ